MVQQRLVRFQFDRRALFTAVNLPPQPLMFVQLTGRVFELLVLEQTSHQFLTGIRSVFFINGRLVGWKQHLGLDLKQSRRHHEKLPCDSQIQLFHRFDIGEVLLSNQVDGNVVDVDLALPNEME